MNKCVCVCVCVCVCFFCLISSYPFSLHHHCFQFLFILSLLLVLISFLCHIYCSFLHRKCFLILSWRSFITPFFFQISSALTVLLKRCLSSVALSDMKCVPFLLPQQLFKGKFYHCLGLDVRNITNKSDCLLANYKWVHHKYNFDNLGQVSLFSDWAYQITWQIHKIPNTEQLNLLLCSIYLFLCESIPEWPLLYITCGCLSVLAPYLSVQPHLSLFFLLVFPPISILLRVLACARMNVCLCFTGSDVPVCAGIEGRLGQHHVSWFGFSGSGPAGNALHVTCSSW